VADLHDVESRLEGAVERSRARVGAALTDDAKKLLESYVNRAASELAQPGRGEEDFDRAVKAFDSLLFEATFHFGEAERDVLTYHIPRRGPRAVTARQLRLVLDHLCPGFWPFC